MKCKLRSIWFFITTPLSWTGIARVGGHRFDYENRTKGIDDEGHWESMECVDCGHISKSYLE